MPSVDELLRPWFEGLVREVEGLAMFDAHTHVGTNDPDGFRQSPEELLADLARADARGVVFAMHEPAGYEEANDRVLEAARGSGGRLVPFCRVDPHGPAVAEARRALAAGARGIKLHPRAERFTLDHPAVRELVALAHEARLPVLIHAGRGIPALGEHTVALAREFPGARLILAHAAISDLAWIWRVVPELSNLLIDTAWWNPSDLLALFALVPPGNILFASDSPYGTTLSAAVQTLRLARQAGLRPAQLRGIAGEQLERVLAGRDPLDYGPAPGAPEASLDPLLERVMVHLTAGLALVFADADPTESLALARLGCPVGEDGPHAALLAAVVELLDTFQEHRAGAPVAGRPILPAARLLVAALVVARTPGVPVPGHAAEAGDRAAA